MKNIGRKMIRLLVLMVPTARSAASSRGIAMPTQKAPKTA